MLAMTNMRSHTIAACALVGVLHAASAHAQSSPFPWARGVGGRVDVAGGISIGPATVPSWSVALHLHIDRIALAAFYTGGASFDLSSSGPGLLTLGGGAGIALAPATPSRRFRAEVLLTGGMHRYSSVGGYEDHPSLYSSIVYTTAVSGTLPFAGVRGDAAWTWGGEVRFSLGLGVSVEVDLTRVQALQKTYPGGWSRGGLCLSGCNEPAGTISTYSLGSLTVLVLLALGISTAN